jgi:hypothetical protein
MKYVMLCLDTFVAQCKVILPWKMYIMINLLKLRNFKSQILNFKSFSYEHHLPV